jgi:TonB family protein
MASTLSLVPSTPGPEENPAHPTGKVKAPAALIQRAGSDGKPDEGICPVEDMLSILRQKLADGSHSPDSVIRATAEAARLLTLADGVAVAFRTKGVISCRARSGQLAPELGSFVNANSGISGECLRTASILVCHDARSDSRVDNEVCHRMGIRSIVVVPLRGPVGIAGILEVFSTRASAFGNSEINSLRGLAEVAEGAYERERLAQLEATRAALRSAHRLPALLARTVCSEISDRSSETVLRDFETEPSDTSPERFFWAIGVAAIALLLILGVWLSWHGPITELAEMEAVAAENRSTSERPPAPVPPVASLPKPAAGITPGDSQKRTNSKVLHVSAGPSKNSSSSGRGVAPDSADAQLAGGSLSKGVNSTAPGEAPTVTIRPADHSQFADLLSGPEPLPVMSAPVSHGVEQGKLIRKVDPVYPVQARAQHIGGSVVLEIRVAEDGMIRNVRTVSGDPQLVTAARQAVRQWQYSPTLLDGHPVETTKQVTVLFKLP